MISLCDIILDMRTIVSIPDEQVRALDQHCASAGISRTEAVRRAILHYLDQQPGTGTLKEAFGLWKDKPFDALKHEDKIRSEWTTRERRARHQHRH